MGEQEDAMPAEKPRAEDDIGASLDNQLDQLRNSSGDVFEVGVLDGDDVAGDGGETAPERRTLSLIPLLQQQAEVVLPLQFDQAFTRAVGRAVVDDDQLGSHRHADNALDDLIDRRPFVVDRHDDG